jgi:hypothetical protein
MTTWKRTIGYTLLALLVSVTAVAQYQTPLPEARANVLSQQVQTPLPEARANVLSQQVQLSSELGLASQITAYPAVAADQTRPGDRLQHLTAKPLDSGLCDNCPAAARQALRFRTSHASTLPAAPVMTANETVASAALFAIALRQSA